MQEEYNAFLHKETWKLATLPQNRKSIRCKWVFRTKRDACGNIMRYKARLVAKGYTQVEGVDFNEIFAPVAKFTTIRCMVALGASLDLEMHQMDVKTAFLNPTLKEEMYMEQPSRFVQGGQHLKCKLKKALYGLKQSGREWYKDMDATLISSGFTRSQADHSLYVKQSNECLMIVIAYVDDLIIMASSIKDLEDLKATLMKEYKMSDLGERHYCLGIEFKRNRTLRTICMNQRKFIQ